MFRGMVLGVCVVGLCASLASADPVVLGKVRDLIPNEFENADADGAATLVWRAGKDNPNLGTVEALVVIKGFKPNTTYQVDIGDAWGVGGPIYTNPQGNGSFRFSSEGGSLNPEFYPDLGTVEVFLNEDEDGMWETGEGGAVGEVQ